MIEPFLSIEMTQASNNETMAGFQATTHNTYKYPISMHLLGKDYTTHDQFIISRRGRFKTRKRLPVHIKRLSS